MVRLKDQFQKGRLILRTNFNSTMVRLKVVGAAVDTIKRLYFNSTMVRLKASANVQEQGCDLLTILYF